MKKVLSTLLAGAMVAGMGASAFAATANIQINQTDLEKITKYAAGATLYDGIVNDNYTIDYSASDRAVVKLGTVFAQDEPKFKIDLLTSMFGEYQKVSGSDEVVYVVDEKAMKSRGYLSATQNIKYTSLEDIEAGLLPAAPDNLRISKYKQAAVDLYNGTTTYLDRTITTAASATDIFTNASTAAATKTEVDNALAKKRSDTIGEAEAQARALFDAYNRAGFITTATSGVKFYDYIGVKNDVATIAVNGSTFKLDVTSGTIQPVVNSGAVAVAGSSKTWSIAPAVIGDTTSEGYFYKDAEVKDYTRNLTSEEIQRSRITLVTQMKGDSSPFKSADIDRSTGQVVVKLKDEWVPAASNKFAVDFEMLMYLKIGGTSFADDTVTITGTLKNKEIDVYSNMDYVDLSDGTVAIPREFNKAISVNVGNGVTIHTKMFKDKKYYGISSREGDEEATQVLRAHKEVSNVVTMKVFGLNNDNDNVTFGNDYADYYVYDANMNYLGRGTDKVSFSTKYYFADSEIEFEEEEGEEEEPEPDDEPADGDGGDANEAPASTGGDATQSPNVNNNPGTGR